jgi:hypothetical protein
VQVVGSSNSHVFVTGSNGVGMTDLNTFLNLPDGLFWEWVNGNNHGQVIAAESVPIIPEPESYVLMLPVLRLLDL